MGFTPLPFFVLREFIWTDFHIQKAAVPPEQKSSFGYFSRLIRDGRHQVSNFWLAAGRQHPCQQESTCLTRQAPTVRPSSARIAAIRQKISTPMT
jgi:hypothetical protein